MIIHRTFNLNFLYTFTTFSYLSRVFSTIAVTKIQITALHLHKFIVESFTMLQKPFSRTK